MVTVAAQRAVGMIVADVDNFWLCMGLELLTVDGIRVDFVVVFFRKDRIDIFLSLPSLSRFSCAFLQVPFPR
jgi:hypothetical protein